MKLRLPNSGNIVSIVAGCIGLLAAVLVGTGEFLLHFDPMARYAGCYVFFEAVSGRGDPLARVAVRTYPCVFSSRL